MFVECLSAIRQQCERFEKHNRDLSIMNMVLSTEQKNQIGSKPLQLYLSWKFSPLSFEEKLLNKWLMDKMTINVCCVWLGALCVVL